MKKTFLLQIILCERFNNRSSNPTLLSIQKKKPLILFARFFHATTKSYHKPSSSIAFAPLRRSASIFADSDDLSWELKTHNHSHIFSLSLVLRACFSCPMYCDRAQVRDVYNLECDRRQKFSVNLVLEESTSSSGKKRSEFARNARNKREEKKKTE